MKSELTSYANQMDNAAQRIIHRSLIVQAKALRSGEVSAVALCQAYLSLIEKMDPNIHAFVEYDAKHALAQASIVDEQLSNGIDLGILHGIPFAVKDLYFVDGFKTRAGSKTELEHEQQAKVVDTLLDQGAICLGKLATYEYATVGPAFDLPYEIVRNPVNPLHVTGGSSSGSAAAVASRMLRFSLGTDTGGSIRSPASYCGIVGLKPTFGALSSQGIVPLSPSLDVPGIMSATSLEALIVFKSLSTKTTQQPSELTASIPDYFNENKTEHSALVLQGKKIGYARQFFADDPLLDPEILSAMDKAASLFSELGASVQEIELPDYQPLEDAAAVILHVEAYQYHAKRLKDTPDSFGNLARNSLLYGESFDLDQLLSAHLVRQKFESELAALFKRKGFDAILTINTLSTAAMISECSNDKPKWSPMRTIAFNLTGSPVLALPLGMTKSGLPMGLQLIGDKYSEELLCQIGHHYETQVIDFIDNETTEGFGILI